MADCPYGAIAMEVRSDGRPFEGEAVVDPDLCVACGICAGSCPTATPFRRMSDLVPGIDLPDRPIAAIRADVEAEAARIAGASQRVIVFAWAAAALGYSTTQASSLVGVVVFGSLTGAMLPFLLRALRVDPAVASAPLVATLVDVTGLIIYFTIAFHILHGTLL